MHKPTIMRKKHLTQVVLVILFIAFTALVVRQAKQGSEVKLKNDIELKSRETKLIELNNKYDKVLELKTNTEKEKDIQAEQIKQLESEKDRLQRDLQAKLDKQASDKQKLAVAAQNASGRQSVHATPARVTPTGNCAGWIAGAGIADVGNANELIRRESNCNPHAVNKSSGACGVAQELPCGKSGCSLGDGACQVKFMHTYVKARYGSWASAVAFHDRNNWY